MPYVSKLVELCNGLGCEFYIDEPLKKHTTFKVGGSCKLFVEISSIEVASRLVSYCSENSIRYSILGNGSNVIVSDSGFDGVILHLGSRFSNIETLEGGRLKCYGGTSL
jgi:UDP-N-acetylmuramate dehydrogenase